MACFLKPHHDVGRDGHHGGRRGLCDGAARPEAHVGFPHRQPDRLHHYRLRTGDAAGHRRRPAALPQPQPLQGRPVPCRRIRAARYGNPRHEPARRTGAPYAAHFRGLADQRRQHDGRPLHERIRQQMAALHRRSAGRASGASAGRLGSQRGHGLLLRQSHQLRFPRPHHAAVRGRAGVNSHHGLGARTVRPGQRSSRPRSAVGRPLHHQSHPSGAGHGHGAGVMVRSHPCRWFLVDHGRFDAGPGFGRRRL